MSDMSAVIIPKSDQINADDLIGGPITITIVAVKVQPGTEQPVSIDFGDPKKVFRPCKSMSRVMVAAWGPDSSKYAGKSLTLYRDPKVKWGGLEVGGIRISHMSGIDTAMTMALTETKQSRKPFTVKPLASAPQSKPAPATSPPNTWADGMDDEIKFADDAATFHATWSAAIKTQEWGDLKETDKPRSDKMKAAATAKLAALKAATSDEIEP